MAIQTSLAAKQRGFSGSMMLREVCFVLIVLTMSGLFASYAGRPKAPMASPAVPGANAAAGYGQLPLSFVPNAGQSDASVHYQARGMGGTLFFEDDAVVLSLPAAESGRQVVRLRFEGADKAHRMTQAEPLPGTVNYFIGNDASRWLTGLPTYGSIIYQQLYPGIDLRYDGAQSTLKGTYTLAAQADPARIRWRYEGVTRAQVDGQTGDLVLRLADASELIEKAPSAWQTQDGARVSVAVQYVLMADGSIGFALGDYDPSQPLTIDPQLIYSTYLGGSAFDWAKSVAVDFAGNAYITGVTQSANFPTHNPISAALQGAVDAFVVKINPTGTALVYATYLGGTNGEDQSGGQRAGGIAVDSSGYAYVTGCTNSADFPTVYPIQGVHGATTNCDAFVSKLSVNGSALIYSTFLGGPGNDTANAIAVDDQGSAYVAGEAGKDFPGSSSSFTSSGHVFVTKINPAGSAFVFSWFFGGNSFEYATDIAVDSAHSTYIVGNTFSTNYPVSLNAAQATIGGGTSAHHDAFVTKIQADGSTLAYSTYLGGSNTDEASGIAVDNLGNAYITGVTQSLDFPTRNAYQPVYGGERGDAFVTKLNPTGTEFVYSTYLGGNNDENYYGGHGPYGAIAVDSTYNVFVTGYTCSANFPTFGSLLRGKSGTCFAFATQFKEAGNGLASSILIGTRSGGSDAMGTDLALDAQGNVYVIGETNASDFLAKNPLQTSYAGMYDSFVTKFDPHFFAYLPLLTRPPQLTATVQVTAPNGSEQWQPGTTHTITWKQTGLSGSVTLQLYKGASLSSEIAAAGATVGSFSWAIPAGQVTGNDYRIRIFQGLVEDYSDANFLIVPVRKYDLVGVWSTGIFSRNSDSGAWNLITSSVAAQVAMGDMDGDGKDDVVASFPGSGLWVKYSATGAWQFISSPPTWFTVGDFNGDGKADLAGIWGGIIWQRDSATGSWTAGAEPADATQIAAGDMDGDGNADLVVNYPTTGVWVMYSVKEKWVNLNTSPVTRIAVGDFNGDGKADLVELWDGIIWLRDSDTGVSTQLFTSPLVNQIAAGDMDGDGIADLVANFSTTGVWVKNSSTGLWSSLSTAPANWITTGLLR